MKHRITAGDLKELWCCCACPEVDVIGGFKYRPLTKEEYDDYLLKVVNTLMDDNITVAGSHRHDQWQSGWEENLGEFRKTKEIISLVPKYHNKFKYVRWKQEPVMPLTPRFDVYMLKTILAWLKEEYLSNYKHIYEFGCGSCYNLQQLRSLPNVEEITGLDWADSSGDIIKEFNSIYGSNLRWKKFDFYEPDNSMEILDDSVFLTVAALEQVGTNFEEFLNFCMLKRPSLCVHVEPIEELLDESNLMDKLSIHYFRKRNYLHGFLNYLRGMEVAGDIEILRAQRTYTGSFFIEGHSVIVWRPL
jgi:hypothetical protein